MNYSPWNIRAIEGKSSRASDTMASRSLKVDNGINSSFIADFIADNTLQHISVGKVIILILTLTHQAAAAT